MASSRAASGPPSWSRVRLGGFAVERLGARRWVRGPPLPERSGRVAAISAQTESMVRMLRRCGRSRMSQLSWLSRARAARARCGWRGRRESLRSGGVLGGESELGEDAFAEFGGGFAGEGDGEDFFGLLVDGSCGEQLEEALDEEAGFAGAGGGFDDAGWR